MDWHSHQRAKELDSQSNKDNEPPTRFQGYFFRNNYQDEDFEWDEEDILQEGNNISDNDDLSTGNNSVESSNIDNTDELKWELSIVEAQFLSSGYKLASTIKVRYCQLIVIVREISWQLTSVFLGESSLAKNYNTYYWAVSWQLLLLNHCTTLWECHYSSYVLYLS